MTEQELRELIEKECKNGNKKGFMLFCYNSWLNIGCPKDAPKLLPRDVEWESWRK